MKKVWKDIDSIFTNDMTDDKKAYEYMMKTIPTIPKDKKYSNTSKVYEKDSYIIIKVYSRNKIGFIVYNTEKNWEDGHSHINSFEMARTIISNVIHHKKPKTNNIYLMRSHMRISNNKDYIRYIDELINTKRNKSNDSYYNKR